MNGGRGHHWGSSGSVPHAAWADSCVMSSPGVCGRMPVDRRPQCTAAAAAGAPFWSGEEEGPPVPAH